MSTSYREKLGYILLRGRYPIVEADFSYVGAGICSTGAELFSTDPLYRGMSSKVNREFTHPWELSRHNSPMQKAEFLYVNRDSLHRKQSFALCRG